MAILHNGSEVTAIKYGLADIAKVMYGTDLVWKAGGIIVSGFEGWVDKGVGSHSSRYFWDTSEGYRGMIFYGQLETENGSQVLKAIRSNTPHSFFVNIPELAGKDYNFKAHFRSYRELDDRYISIHLQGIKGEEEWNAGLNAIALSIGMRFSRASRFTIRKRGWHDPGSSTGSSAGDILYQGPQLSTGGEGEMEYIAQRRGTTGYFKLIKMPSRELVFETTVENLPFDDTGTTIGITGSTGMDKYYNFELEIL